MLKNNFNKFSFNLCNFCFSVVTYTKGEKENTNFLYREVQNADKKYQIKFLAKIIHHKYQKSEKMGTRKKPDGKIEYFQF